MRLDLFIKENLPFLMGNSSLSDSEKVVFENLPRTFWQKEIKSGNIKFQNKIVKPSINMAFSEKFLINIDWKKIKNNWSRFFEKKLVPAKLNLDFIKVTPDYLVLNKPAGIIVHPAFPLPRDSERVPSVIEGTVYKFPDIAEAVEKDEEERPGIVHRLDKNTSGAFLIARSREAKIFFKDQFKSRRIKKTYLALVEGDFSYEKFEIKSLIGKLKNNPMKRSISDLHVETHCNASLQKRWAKIINPKIAITQGEKIAGGTLDRIAGSLVGTKHAVFLQWKKYIKSTEKDDFSLLELFPKTGRTHQIRVHLSSLGFPIVGDILYGSCYNLRNGFHCLHSYELSWFDGFDKQHSVQADRVILF